MVNDLVELKKLTQSLIEHERRIKLGVNRWESILNSIPVPIFITNDVGHVEFVNEAMTAEMGNSREQMEGSFCHKIVGHFDKRIDCYCGTTEKDDCFFKEDLVIEGQFFTHSRTPIKDDDDKTIGYICTLYNVTEFVNGQSDNINRQNLCHIHAAH